MMRSLAISGPLLFALLHAGGARLGAAEAVPAAQPGASAGQVAAPARTEQPGPARAEASPAPVWVIDPGLIYVRAAQQAGGGALALPGEPRSNHDDSGGFVLDLRYVAGGERERVLLGEWLAKWAAAGVVPIFILVNEETVPALRLAAAQFVQTHAALLIGPETGMVSPDIALPIDPAQERAAYAALAAGGAAASALLIGEAAVANKPRYDEAAVIAAHTDPATKKSASADGDSDSGPATAPTRGTRRRAPPRPATQPPQEPPAASAEDGGASPIDLSLQRAIYLHRAWRALKLHP